MPRTFKIDMTGVYDGEGIDPEALSDKLFQAMMALTPGLLVLRVNDIRELKRVPKAIISDIKAEKEKRKK